MNKSLNKILLVIAFIIVVNIIPTVVSAVDYAQNNHGLVTGTVNISGPHTGTIADPFQIGDTITVSGTTYCKGSWCFQSSMNATIRRADLRYEEGYPWAGIYKYLYSDVNLISGYNKNTVSVGDYHFYSGGSSSNYYNLHGETSFTVPFIPANYIMEVNSMNNGSSNEARITIPFTVSCIDGTVWDTVNGKCVSSVPPAETCFDGIQNQNETGKDTGGICASGTLKVSPTSCIIGLNKSTCTVTGATWTTEKATSPTLIDGNMGNTLSSLANKTTPLLVWVAYPQTVFNLKDDTKLLDSKTVTASCGTGTAWDDTKCVMIPTATCSVSPNPAIYSLTNNIVNMSINSSNATNCTVKVDDYIYWSNYDTSGILTINYTGIGTSVGSHQGKVSCSSSESNGPGSEHEHGVNSAWFTCDYSVINASNLTTGTLTGDDCTIALGGNTCTTKLTLNIINPVTGATTNITKAGNVQVASGITPPAKPNIVVNYPNTTFYLNHDTKTLNSKTVTASCGTNTWDGGKCVTPTPTTTGTLTGDDCTIALGGNTCTTKLTLNIINPVAGAATNITKAGNVQVASGITPVAKPNIVVNYPNTTFYLNHNGNTLNSKIVTASCGTNVWDNVTKKCVSTTPTTPTGTLSATDCTITTAGASTCVSKLTWTTSNLIAGKATAVTRNNPASTPVSTATSGTNVSNTINYGSSTYYLYHNGAEPPLATKSVTASCDATKLTWDIVSQTCKTTIPPCPNGATNPPECTTFTPCANGATNPPACTTFTPCPNGANNPPTCSQCTAPLVWNTSLESCVNSPTPGHWEYPVCPEDCGLDSSPQNPICTGGSCSLATKPENKTCPATSACTTGGNLLNITFIAYPPTIWKGSGSTLTWTSDATECFSVPSTGDGSFNTTGSANGFVKVYPKTTVTYKIQCTKESAPESETTEVKVTSINIIES